MNKDVIYVEPENDITDIISRIEGSKEKIIALVPPKKAAVFRSVVNIKLMAKAGHNAEKTIVLVTTDPSIVRLAATVKLPVTKSLQSAPVIPTLESDMEDSVTTEMIEVSEDGAKSTKADVMDTKSDSKKSKDTEQEYDTSDSEESSSDAANKPEDTEDEPEHINDEEYEADHEKDAKKSKSKSKSKTKLTDKIKGGWCSNHKKLLIFGSIGLVALILLFVWAFVIVPAVNIVVWIQTDNKNFSESVSFTTNLSDENASEGIFYLEEKKIETVQEEKFEATGEKNLGEKATGSVIVYAYFKEAGAIPISAGSTFTNSGLSFISNESAMLQWDGEDDDACSNASQASSLVLSGCLVSKRVNVTAAEPGTKYNIGASETGWNTLAQVLVRSDQRMDGGTDNIVTVVQQSDVVKAKEKLNSSNESENKAKLFESVGDDLIRIDSSFVQTTSEAIATPAVGEEVKDGTIPTVKATTTAKLYAIDKAKVIEFITAKADIADDQKVYDMDDPFIENFTKTSSGYIGKLKTSYSVGPKVTDEEVVEMAKGKGIGDIQHELKKITGIVNVETNTSYPWVMSAPDDSNRITVEIKVKDNTQEINTNEG